MRIHSTFEISVGSVSLRHRATLTMYDVIFNKLRIDLVDEGEADVFNVQMIDVKFLLIFIIGHIVISNDPEPFRIQTDLDTFRKGQILPEVKYDWCKRGYIKLDDMIIYKISKYI